MSSKEFVDTVKTDKILIENPPKGNPSYSFFRRVIDKDVEAEEVWQNKWKNIIMRDGKVNLEQLKMELFDYEMLMEQSSKVYNYVTGGKIRTPNYLAEGVVIAFKEFLKNLSDEDINLIRS